MTNNLVDYFEEHHTVTIPIWWLHGRPLLIALLSAREATQNALNLVPSSVRSTEPAFGLLRHLSERVYEHVAASIVCFATANAATAEVASRVAMESAVNIRFILCGDRNSLTLAWLRDYVTLDARQIDQWEKLLNSLPAEETTGHAARIDSRKQVNKARHDFLAQAEIEFSAVTSVNLASSWPNIATRFGSIGESAAYRTVYARLSSQTHTDAEDTINLVMFFNDKSLLLKMSQETVAFSEFLLTYSAYFYLLSLKKLCETYSASTPTDLDSGIQQMLLHMREISTEWHW